jgi:hypothetical protein
VLVGAIGLEPTTPTMSRWCSNQLSYAPKELRILANKTSVGKSEFAFFVTIIIPSIIHMLYS